MATKDSILKKRLVKEGIVYLVALVALIGGGMLMSNMDDDAQTEKQNKGNESTAMRSEHDAIEQQLGTGFEVNAFYNTYIKNRSSDFQLRREVATQWMSTLHEKNHLTDLSVIISPLADVNFDFAQLKSGSAVKSEVKLSFAGVTDNSFYGFLTGMEREMPGMILVNDIKLTRNADLSRDVLVYLSQHHISPLMTGDMSFYWLGLRPSDASRTDNTLPGGVNNGAR